MKFNIYQIDAFTDRVFSGNPAAVCPLDKWLDDDILQKIAMENNLAETVFYVRQENQYHIRWFTPTTEIDLCGHATLAAAFVLFNLKHYKEERISFYSPRSGTLAVSKHGELLTLNFPCDVLEPLEISKNILDCFDRKPKRALKGKTDYMLEFEKEEDIKAIVPSFDTISKLNCRGVIVTAKGSDVDFVSRFFAPQSGIDEDLVTGSAHTTLIPYWSKELGKNKLTAKQLSKRMGYLTCNYVNDRVEIGGQCKLYLVGEIYLK